MMAICRLMISDFMQGTGRFPACFNHKRAYSDMNLVEGIDYCEWLIEEGYKTEPFFDFDLRAFIEWAKPKIRRGGKYDLSKNGNHTRSGMARPRRERQGKAERIDKRTIA